MEKQTRIIIVDDHPLFREGLKSVLERDARFTVVGEAGTGESGISLIERLKPDLVLMDISMPGKDGIQITRKIRSTYPDLGIIIITMHSEISYITMAFQAGVNGYLAKESAADKLLETLDTVLDGEYYLDSLLSPSIVGKLKGGSQSDGAVTGVPYNSLTPREQQILRLLAEGYSTQEVAKSLFISPKTVENHRGRVMKKLGLRGDIDLVRYAARIGLIEMDIWKE